MGTFPLKVSIQVAVPDDAVSPVPGDRSPLGEDRDARTKDPYVGGTTTAPVCSTKAVPPSWWPSSPDPRRRGGHPVTVAFL